MKKVSVIIANRNDIAMLAVTVRSCIEELKHLDAEIVIVDNSDPDVWAAVMSALPVGYCAEGLLKIVRQDFPCLFTAREKAIEEASGYYVICLDSHMIVGKNMIIDLVYFMDSMEGTEIGFAHAPINWAHQHERSAKHDRDVSVNELGNWNLAYKHERTITWKGMPWICKREWFLDKENGLGGYGALSEHRISWGGGDLHIGVKPWLLGYKNWAVPTSPGIHIGPFPKIDRKSDDKNIVSVSNAFSQNVKYRLWSQSGVGPHAFGFLVSCYVLGGEDMMRRNKEAITERFGRFINVDKWWDKAIELGQNEKDWLDDRKVMTFVEFIRDKPWDEGFKEAA